VWSYMLVSCVVIMFGTRPYSAFWLLHLFMGKVEESSCKLWPPEQSGVEDASWPPSTTQCLQSKAEWKMLRDLPPPHNASRAKRSGRCFLTSVHHTMPPEQRPQKGTMETQQS
jgi:hypothetical protein